MRSSRIGIFALVIAAALATGCTDREAKATFDEAVRLARQGRYDEAITVFHEVEKRFPRSVFAKQASREVQSLHDVLSAGKRYQTDRAVEIVRTTTRAVERFRADRGRWPGRLDELVPRWLERVETDPWGRSIRYERVRGGYRVACFGADGKPGGSGDDQDVVVENGEFKVEPSAGDA